MNRDLFMQALWIEHMVVGAAFVQPSNCCAIVHLQELLRHRTSHTRVFHFKIAQTALSVSIFRCFCAAHLRIVAQFFLCRNCSGIVRCIHGFSISQSRRLQFLSQFVARDLLLLESRPQVLRIPSRICRHTPQESHDLFVLRLNLGTRTIVFSILRIGRPARWQNRMAGQERAATSR